MSLNVEWIDNPVKFTVELANLKQKRKIIKIYFSMFKQPHALLFLSDLCMDEHHRHGQCRHH